jgi:hypothetical protein
MKTIYIYFSMLLVILISKACCYGPPAIEKTIDNGILEDSVKIYLPYKDSSKVSFLDTNNVKVDYNIKRYLQPGIMFPSKCKFCCKGTLYTYKWQEDNISLTYKKDSSEFRFLTINIANREKNCIDFYGSNLNYFVKVDSLNFLKKLDNVIINSKSYNNVFKLKPRYSNDTSEYLLFNKEFGVLKINYKNGKSFSLLSID